MRRAAVEAPRPTVPGGECALLDLEPLTRTHVLRVAWRPGPEHYDVVGGVTNLASKLQFRVGVARVGVTALE